MQPLMCLEYERISFAIVVHFISSPILIRLDPGFSSGSGQGAGISGGLVFLADVEGYWFKSLGNNKKRMETRLDQKEESP